MVRTTTYSSYIEEILAICPLRRKIKQTIDTLKINIILYTMPLNTVQMYTQKTNTTLKYQNKPKLIHKTFSLSEL